MDNDSTPRCALARIDLGQFVAIQFFELRPIQICDDAGVNFATTSFFAAETDKIWTQAGIDISFAPPIAQIFNNKYLDVSYQGVPGVLPAYREAYAGA